MYSVRQIVSLFREYADVWRATSVNHLRCWAVLRNDEPLSTHWDQRSDAELIDAVIDILTEGVLYYLGYQGQFTLKARNGLVGSRYDMAAFRFRFGTKSAYEMEYAVVHILHRYSDTVNNELRERLVDTYGEWESSPDQETVPHHVTL